MVRSTLLWTLAAIAGVVIVAGVTYAASGLSTQTIGLSSEPLSAGEDLAPAETSAPKPKPTPEKARRHRKKRARPTPTPTPVPAPPVAPTVDPSIGMSVPARVVAGLGGQIGRAHV